MDHLFCFSLTLQSPIYCTLTPTFTIGAMIVITPLLTLIAHLDLPSWMLSMKSNSQVWLFNPSLCRCRARIMSKSEWRKRNRKKEEGTQDKGGVTENRGWDKGWRIKTGEIPARSAVPREWGKVWERESRILKMCEEVFEVWCCVTNAGLCTVRSWTLLMTFCRPAEREAHSAH